MMLRMVLNPEKIYEKFFVFKNAPLVTFYSLTFTPVMKMILLPKITNLKYQMVIQ